MFVSEKNGMIAIYRNFDLMMEGVTSPASSIMFMLSADFIISIDKDNAKLGRVVKDRTGIFSSNALSIKKILEIINFLYETEKNFNK